MMEHVAGLLQKADHLMDQAEMRVETDLEKGRLFFQEAVICLEQAYLAAAGEEAEDQGVLMQDMKALFQKCLQREGEFEVIQSAIELLAGSNGEPEQICDAANEIWDFMYGLMEEME